MSEARILSAEEAEQRALLAAVTAARADPRPDVPHKAVREEMLRETEDLRLRLAVLPTE